MADTPLSVGVLAYNGRAYLPACLDSVLAQAPPPAEVVVLDNGSADGSADLVAARYPGVRLVRGSENTGVAVGLNCLVDQTTSPLVVLLNQDVELDPGCLAALADRLSDPTVAVVGAKLLFPDRRTVQHAGGYLERPRLLAQHHGFRQPDDGRWEVERRLDYVTGAVFAVRRAAWQALGGLDPLFSPAYFEETDFCLRATAAGWRVVYQPQAVAVHHESTTLGRESRAYLALYHRHRLVLALRHLPVSELLDAFAPAEAEAVARTRSALAGQRDRDELDGLAGAYDYAAQHLAEVLAGRADAPLSAATVDALTERLARLRRDAESREEEGGVTTQPERDVAEVIEIRDPAIDVEAVMAQIRANLAQRKAQGAYRQDLDGIAHQVFAEVMAERPMAPVNSSAGHIVPLAELQEQWAIREPSFASQAPVVGPVIVGVRTAWNWMSTKWYVRVIVQQVQNFHLLTVRAFQDIDTEHRQLAEQVQRLEALSQHQAQELAQLRAEVEWLREASRGETEPRA